MKESKNKKTHDDEIINMTAKLWKLERENELLESEIAAIQRLLWSNFEELIDNSSLLRKAKLELGEERYKQMYDEYIEQERSEILEKHKQKAIKGLCILDFTEVYKFLPEKKFS